MAEERGASHTSIRQAYITLQTYTIPYLCGRSTRISAIALGLGAGGRRKQGGRRADARGGRREGGRAGTKYERPLAGPKLGRGDRGDIHTEHERALSNGTRVPHSNSWGESCWETWEVPNSLFYLPHLTHPILLTYSQYLYPCCASRPRAVVDKTSLWVIRRFGGRRERAQRDTH